MAKIRKHRVQFFLLAFASVMLILWQNCSGINLNHVNENSAQCVSPSYQISQDTPVGNSVLFKVELNDGTHTLIHESFDWSLTDANNVAVSPAQTAQAETFTINTSQLVSCSVYHVHAKYSDCDGNHDLIFPYRPGDNCDEIPPTYPPNDPPASCPAGRISSSNIYYPTYDHGTRRNADLTKFENIYGYGDSADTSVDLFPGYGGAMPVIMQFTKTGYIAAKFHVPANLDSQDFGIFGVMSYYSGANLIMSISNQCGDFSPANALCTRTAGTGESLVRWTSSTGTAGCTLTPNTDYYVNIKIDPTDTTTPNCTGNNCQVGLTYIH